MAGELETGTWVTFLDGRATALRVRRVRLTVVGGPDKGVQREVEARTIRIGGRKSTDLPLNDPLVSGQHAELTLDEHGYRLRDLDSKNGTFVGGLRVKEVWVAPGATITVGGTKLLFEPLEASVEVALSADERCGGMYGRSIAMRALFAKIGKLAATDATVLVTGETGTGKELVAEALHDRSARASGPLVVLDCGSIPATLVESELFGHERGAFTGAISSRAGAFERAHGGTIFLDELGELPLELQAKLLRVLERREVRRVGGQKTIPLDLRVVAATNRDLTVEVTRGRFREDLFYRLAVARVHVPPLRDRREDIPLLVAHFLETLPGGGPPSLKPETMDLMMKHDWPGNVRELRNVVERAALLAEVPSALGKVEAEPVAPSPSPSPSTPPAPEGGPGTSRYEVAVDVAIPFKTAKQDVVEDFERRYIKALLEAHDGNISAAARATGIDRMSIHKILNRLGLERPRG